MFIYFIVYISGVLNLVTIYENLLPAKHIQYTNKLFKCADLYNIGTIGVNQSHTNMHNTYICIVKIGPHFPVMLQFA